jgi:hypothetical protein
LEAKKERLKNLRQLRNAFVGLFELGKINKFLYNKSKIKLLINIKKHEYDRKK